MTFGEEVENTGVYPIFGSFHFGDCSRKRTPRVYSARSAEKEFRFDTAPAESSYLVDP